MKLAEVNAEHAEVEEDLVRKKREVEPVESKLQVVSDYSILNKE